MKLALEIPVGSLEQISRLTDFDFALSHLVLADKTYAEFYANQKRNKRRVVLDNGMYEMGQPLPVAEILEAASRIDPSVVIPPDKLGDSKFTLDGFRATASHPKRKSTWDVALVLQGTDRNERLDLFMRCKQYTNTLMLPFREPRFGWFLELLQGVPAYSKWPQYLHLLGVNELAELRSFTTHCQDILNYSNGRVFVDTGKPVKYGMQNKLMHEVETLRGGGKLDHSATITGSQLQCIYHNIAYLRRFTS